MVTPILLVFAWLLLSGHYTTGSSLIASFGVASVIAVVLLARRMDKASLHSSESTVGFRVLLYIPWLLKEIVKANLQVARIIIDPKLPISPRLIRVRASQRGEGGQVLYANSITLTPGTISLDVRKNTIAVHALTTELADGLASGEMDEKVARTEKPR